MLPFNWLNFLGPQIRPNRFLSSTLKRKTRSRHRSGGARTASYSATRTETLEDRTLLTAFTVLNTNDSGAGSLRDAIEQANANAGADTISFDAALAGQTIVLSNELIVNDDLTITGLGADLLTLDGNGDSRIFNIDDGSNATTIMIEISGLTLTNGNSNESGTATDGHGGAILSLEDLTVKDSTLIGNTARLGGGAIYHSEASLTIENSLITENVAMLHGGGGVYYFRSGGTGLIINESTFSHNSALNGAGRGGALFFYEGVASIRNSTFTENVAEDTGGAIKGSGSMTIESSTLRENVSGYNGGAIDNSGELFVYNSTVSDNETLHLGGGIYSFTTATLEVVNSTIVSNYSRSAISQGAAIYGSNSIPFTISNSIIAANTSASSSQIVGLYTETANIISDSLSGLIDPMLRDNGGFTKTHALLPGSTALNAGNNSAATSAGLTTDQRGTGFSRVVNGTVDIGAFESQTYVFLVDTNSDLDDGDYSVGELSLREAIKLANTNPGADTIHFDATLSSQTIVFDSEILISDSLTIVGLGANQLTLDGNDNSRIFSIDDGSDLTTITVEISGLKLTKGNIHNHSNSVFDDNGGAVFSSEDLIVKNSIFVSNAGRRGGAIYQTDASLTVIQSEFTENEVTSSGGAIYKDGGPLTIKGSLFSSNNASGSDGGAIYHKKTFPAQAGDELVSIENSQFTGNYANFSGAAVLLFNGIMTVTGSTFTENRADFPGGAIRNIFGDLTVSDSSFIRNYSDFSGGAISNGGNLFVSGSTFSENAVRGTGGAIHSQGGGSLSIYNSTLSNNESTIQGGGIYVLGTKPFSVINSTIIGNESKLGGGGIYMVGVDPVTIVNNIIAGNIANSDAQVDGKFTGDSNIIQDSINGLLDPVLRDNGGPTKTHALLVDSAALNAGNNTAATNAGLATDQRGVGYTRVVDGIVDIGAFEFSETVSLNLIVDTISDLDDGDYTLGQLSLREAIKLANASATVNSIVFDASLSGQSIMLNSELVISDDLTITGLGADQLTLDANNSSRIFKINDGNIATTITVEIDGLTLTNGDTKSTGGAIQSYENLTVKNSTLKGNTAQLGGGAIYSSLASLDIIDSLITENSALFQGGGGVMYLRSGGTGLSVNQSTFSLNSAVGSKTGQGGAIYFFEGDASILNSTFTENSGDTNGGAIHNSYMGSVVVDSSTFNQNTAYGQNGSGGALSNESELFVINSTLSGNSADFLGGGIYTYRYTTLEIVNSTIVANQATSSVSQGGAIYSSNPNTIQLTNSLVAGNTAVNHIQVDANFAGTNNIISSSSSGLVDPVLRDNGGPTKTHALLYGSAAINTGDNTAATSAGLSTDQRGTGFDRIVDATVDIGAFESAALHFMVDTNSDLDDGDYSVGELSLREAIKLANASLTADTITFDPALAGQSIIFGTEIQISHDLTIIGLGSDLLTLDGNGDSRIFNVDDGSNATTDTVEISGLTLTNGYAYSGGAIQNAENLTLLDMIITDNEAEVHGGGLRNFSLGSLTLTNTQVTENLALRGGGIFSEVSTLHITASTISKNESTKEGGGIHYTHSDLYGNTPAMIIDTTFSENIAGTNGGGIYNSRGHLQVTGSTFSRNAADLGGGLYSIGTADGGIVSISDNTFTENTQVESGGGIYSDNTILTVNGSRFTDNAVNSSGINGFGGGIYNVNGPLEVTDTNFSRNSASNSGGGIYNRSSGTFNVANSTFMQNTAKDGGGIFNFISEMNVMESSFSENRALTGNGGGIAHSAQLAGEDVFEAAISDSHFSKNTAHYSGAGIHLQYSEMTVTGSTFSENHALLNGGGIYSLLATLTVEESAFSENKGSTNGGGISNGGTLVALDSTFSGNTSTYNGGAIYNSSTGTATITNSTISENHSSSRGGGLYTISELSLSILNSTIIANHATNQGGGIYSSKVTPTVTNSIVAGNTANSSSQVFGSVTNQTSIIQDSIEGLIDPVLRDNGGPTKTHALLVGSAALNAGDNSAVINAELSTDQRGTGFTRIVDGTVDIGAFEAQGPLSQFDMRIVNFRTDTESNGETSTLPDNLTWINEWAGYWLEIWVSTSTTELGILSTALELTYNTAITTATSIEFGAAFTENQTGIINDLTGTIENLSAETTLTDVGNDQSVLFARIRFESTVDDAVDLDLDTQSLNSQTPGFEILNPEVIFTGSVASEEVYGPAPETQIYANPYDLNDDDVINFRDLVLIASVYNTIPGESDYSWFADYNQNGRVGFRDVILFASNYQKSKANQSTVNYAPNFPGDWNQLLTVETQLPPQTKAKSITVSAAETVMESVVEQVSPQLTPDQIETLNNVDIQVVDLDEGILGRAVPGTIYIDVNAAGYGWFVDSTPGDHSEFTFSSELTLIALEGTEAAAGVDLWTVILHELGHILGHEHEAEGVMQETLAPGVRNLPDWEEDTDAFFVELTDDSNIIAF